MDQLLVIRRWLELTLAPVDERISAVRVAEAEKARRRPLPGAPPWWIEYGIGVRRAPERVHTGDCPMTGGGRAATLETVQEVFLTVPAVLSCPLCRPDSTLLGLLDT
ncbi:DUF6233 domain-containing protein [Streptomyces sp. NPDC048349]|uniref:DUF6233 domain-containing protein n=1 Tax=Streptomyces sp. NPDC048349 TaxID=3155486 RepID=UPI0034434D7F